MALNDKVFCDFLKEAKILQYLFEYGFSYEDIKILFGETPSYVGKLNQILNVRDQAELLPIESYKTETEQGAHGYQFMIVPNHYQRDRILWAPILYGSFGMSQKYINYWEEMEGADKIETTTKNGQTRMKRRKDEEKVTLLMQACKPSHFTTQNQNTWTKSKMTESHYLKEDATYLRFLHMLAFFAEFAPLSVLGYHFLRRLNADLTHPYIFVRRPYFHDVLEQESAFRCLCAMTKAASQTGIKYEKKTYYEPVKLVYRDKSFESPNAHLYLQVKEKEPIPASQREIWQIEVEFYWDKVHTTYLRDRRIKNRMWKQKPLPCHPNKRENFISPYYPDISEWSVECVQYDIPEEDKEAFNLFVDSFGEFAHIVKCSKYSENVPEQEHRYLPLFHGEYVSGKNQDQLFPDSLCNAYNSNYILNKYKNLEPTAPTQQEVSWVKFIFSHYPNFVKIFLKDCEIDKIKEKLNSTNGKETDLFAYYDTSRWSDLRDDPTLIEKLREVRTVIENKTILHYQKDKENEYCTILPYAMEYDVTAHGLAPNADPPIQVMCYDLNQKRAVMISYQDLPCKENLSLTGSKLVEYVLRKGYFSELDKLYHLLAYTVRSAMMGKEKLKEPYATVVNAILDKMKPEENNYDRLVRKKIKTQRGKLQLEGPTENGYIRDMKQSHEHMLTYAYMDSSPLVDELDQKWKQVFAYYAQDLGDQSTITDYELCYYRWLHFFWTNAIGAIYFPQNPYGSERARKQLRDLPDDSIWALIDGESQSDVLNEISFFDEKLKREKQKLKFDLNELEQTQMEHVVLKVYETFHGYLCKGNVLSCQEKNDTKHFKLHFEVDYEKFDFRDIHMRLMALRRWVNFDSIEPEKDKKILLKRVENCQRNITIG